MKENNAQTQLDLVHTMEYAMFQGNWDVLKSFLTEDIYFKIGSIPEIRGLHAVADYLKQTLPTQIKITGADIRGAWEFEDVVTIEMDVQAIRVIDGNTVGYPSVDIFRFHGNKIREWRIYPVYYLFTA